MNRAALAVALVVALGIGLVGCRSAPPAVDPFAGMALPAEDPRPQALLAALADRAATRTAMRATIRFAVDAEDLNARGSQRVAARKPARLRVEVLSLFGQIAAVLTTDGRTFQFFAPGSGELEEGRVTEGLLWEVARIDLAPAEAVALLVGASTPSRSLSPAGAEGRPDGSVRVALEDTRGQMRQRFDFDPQGRLRRLEEWDALAGPLREVRYDDYRDVAGEDFAHKVELQFPRTAAEARFHFQRVELNPDLADEVFVLDLPERVSSAGGIGN